jgi:hypothetical protein
LIAYNRLVVTIRTNSFHTHPLTRAGAFGAGDASRREPDRGLLDA